MTRGMPGGSALAACVAAALVVVLALGPSSSVAAEPPRPDARAWVLVDAADGEVLAARAPGRRVPIASTTKLMTAYVARRQLDLDERVVAPAYSADPVESVLGLHEGERIRVRDLLGGLLLASGNDAAVALAAAVAGSVPDFVDEMNDEAERLGLERTSYANPIGLDEPNNRSSAADLATLAIEVRRDRFIRRIMDLPRLRLLSGAERRQIVNRNQLVGRVPWVNGMKTGQTQNAGHVLVASGTRMGVTLVSVVLGANDEEERDEGSLDLLRYGFSLYQRVDAVERRERVARVPVRYRDDPLPALAARPVRLTLRDGQGLRTETVVPEQVEGPIERGATIGHLLVLVDGERVDRVRLLAGRDVSAPSVLERVDAAVPGPRAVVWALALAGLAMLALCWRALRERRRGRRRRLASSP